MKDENGPKPSIPPMDGRVQNIEQITFPVQLQRQERIVTNLQIEEVSIPKLEAISEMLWFSALKKGLISKDS
jgi:hypothetical protein